MPQPLPLLSPWLAFGSSFLLAFLFVAILYLPHPSYVPENASRNDPRVILLRFRRIGFLCLTSPIVVGLILRIDYVCRFVCYPIKIDGLSMFE
jgi:hypothetical protein